MSKQSLGATVAKMPKTFWVANTLEIFERMAWYGFFAVSSLYITGKVEEGALGFSSEQRGFLQGVVTFFLYLFPVLTGALADRFGYKKMFLCAFTVLTPAYWLLGQFHQFGSFFVAFMLVAVGAAMFKPVVVGTVARVTNDDTASLGFGIFYMMVNIGGFLGPMLAGLVRTRFGWPWVFVMSALWISFNFIWVTLLYREPTTEAASANRRSLRQVLSGIVEVLGNGRFFLTVLVVIFLIVLGGGTRKLPWSWIAGLSVAWIALNVVVDLVLPKETQGRPWFTHRMRLGDWRFGLYLLLLSGFWTVYNQIFMTMPEYLRDFTNTTPILQWSEGLFTSLGLTGAAAWVHEMITSGYQINPEYLINLDSAAIVLFQVVVSWAVAKRQAFSTMMWGLVVMAVSMVLAALGGAGAGVTAWFSVAAIVVFSFGEMATSPKSQEYVGSIAPKEKVAMYMGYYFVSVALGNLFGGILSGALYGWLARDMHRPDIMWIVYAVLSVVTAATLFAYDRFALRGRKQVEEKAALAA